MAGRRTTHFRGTKTRRLTMWIAGQEAANTLAGAGSEVLSGSFNAAALALRPFTIIRVRGIIGISSDQGTAGEDQSAAYGICVVSDQAIAAGVASIPSPNTDQGSDLFFVYEDLVASMFVASNAGVEPQFMTSRTFDSKAMRKVNDDQDIAVVKANTTLSDGTVVYDRFRMLLKLH